MVTLTERAARQVRRLLAEDADAATATLRVTVAGGGCAGFQYALAFDGPPRAGDAVFESHGVRVVVERAGLAWLDGSRLDYAEGADGAGFRVVNPHAVAGCGCGATFHAREAAAVAPAGDGCGPSCGCSA